MLDAGGLDRINTLPKLLDYLRENCDWPIEEENFEDLVFDWDPKELGLKDAEEYREIEIKQLRPLTSNQPWGVFFVNFPKKDLKVTVLRRILGALTVKRRKSANAGERAAWQKHDLLFLSAYGDSGHRRLTFAHFQDDPADPRGVARLDVLGWNPDNTIRRLSEVRHRLTDNLRWPGTGESIERWRARWSSAFDERPRESINTSKQLASALAALAVQIRDRAISLLDEETEIGPLTKLYKAFKEALIHDLTPHRFADMYAQTITYGLLATTFRGTSGPVTADSISMMALPTNPFLADTLKDFLRAGGRKGGIDFDELGVNDVVEMLRRANMEAVLRDFDDRNPEEDPVIHFYESFLKEYDPQERVQRGVFYTPRPVVSFIVRSVDEVLRRDFKLEDGLADTSTWGEMERRLPNLKRPKGVHVDDPFVRILDPATGTGTFLVEVIDIIHTHMTSKWAASGKSKKEIEKLWNDYVPRHLLSRLYAFELMMAPYAIAHMKVGLKLFDTGYKFGSQERARIFLTNALEPAHDLDMQLAFMSEALAQEARAANEAKSLKFTAIIGNPPYSNFGRLNRNPAILELLLEYKRDLNEQKLNLDDDFIKFIRYCQEQIRHSRVGMIGMITNNIYLDGITHRRMRQSLASTFSRVSVVDLHGSVRRAEKNSARDEQNVFDIQQGVAIALMALLPRQGHEVLHTDVWGSRRAKFDTLSREVKFSALTPIEPNYFFVPKSFQGENEWEAWPAISGLMPVYSTGVKTHLDDSFVGFSDEEVSRKLNSFIKENWQDVQLNATQRSSKLRKAVLLKKAYRLHGNSYEITRYSYRALDTRMVSYIPEAIDAGDHRFPLMRNIIGGSLALVTTRQLSRGFFAHALITKSITDMCVLSTATKECAYVFPFWVSDEDSLKQGKRPNLSPLAHKFAKDRGLDANDVIAYFYSVLHSPEYRAKYSEFLEFNFPHIPLPRSEAIINDLKVVGHRLIKLHVADDIAIDKSVRFAGRGTTLVEKGFPKWDNGRVMINAERWFEEVPENVWSFQIGGYQVCEKWLKDRRIDKLGRALDESEILHYRRIVTAISETIDLMAEIDRVIERHGGWPDAFRGMTEAN